MNIQNADVVLGTSPVAVFSVAAGKQFAVTRATVFNSDTISHAVSIYRVPLGSLAAVANEIIGSQTIAAGGVVVLPLSGQSFATQSLQAVADLGGKVNLNVSLAQIT